MGSSLSHELESDDTDTTTPCDNDIAPEPIEATVADIDDKIYHNKISQDMDPIQSLSDFDSEKPNQEVKNEEIADLNYINPSSEEIEKQTQLCLTHICHFGHYLSNCDYSAQNVLQNNSAPYQSLKPHNFDANYSQCDHDWMVFKIDSVHSLKITQFSLEYSTQNEIEQYPSKVCVQFLRTNELKRVIACAAHNTHWSKPYYTKPSVFETTKPGMKGVEHKDTFTVSFAAEYLEQLYNDRRSQYFRRSQYLRVSLIESHGNMGAKESKFCLKNVRVFGVPLLDDSNALIELEMSANNAKQYKYEIENNYECGLQPKPGRNDARILMREQTFFVNVGAHNTVEVLKHMICEEYDRLNQARKGKKSYKAKNIFLIVDGFGLVNDMLDSAVLKKTLPQIGAKLGKNHTGYYIIVGFF